MTYPLPPENLVASLFTFLYWELHWTQQCVHTLVLAFRVCAGLGAAGYWRAVDQSLRALLAGPTQITIMGVQRFKITPCSAL
jgi:hypothetical protein